MAKTKKSAGGTLAVSVALVVGAGFLYGIVKRDFADDSTGAVFSVTFKSAQMRSFVDIVILVDGAQHTVDKTIKSPWSRLVPLRKGQTAVLTATQTVSDKLSCAVNGEVQETRMFPGAVVCTHKRF